MSNETAKCNDQRASERSCPDPPGSRFMKRGKTEAETLKLNGWGVGSILEGDEGYGPDRIIITAIGQERFLCRWRSRITGEWENGESGCTTLSCREWHLIENNEDVDASR